MKKDVEIDTSPITTNPKEMKVKKSISQRKLFWPGIGLISLIIIILLGLFIGFESGIQKRLAQEESSILIKTADQYERGLADIAEGRYENAQQRFEFVIRLDPNYPGAAEKLREVLVIINTKATPTPMPTPTSSIPTPTLTPDFRGADEIYNTIIEMIQLAQWDEAILTINLLRQNFLDYRPVDVDGLYYICLRNRGIQKILTNGELEQGIYDLSLAERFGPLDKDAESYRTWARLYITGASYWDVNWEQVVYYFSQVQPALPNLRDGSGMTATERYRRGLIKYGDQIASTGDFCKAETYYEIAMSLGSDPKAQPTVIWVAEQCWNIKNPTPIPVIITETPTPTVTPDGWIPPGNTPTPTP
ncbi:MAG: hypothetical protein MUO40_07405 [Anaerolineaceae bacterium]|nr:hypothetical protein [Anaerolineaceae bacterium]